MRTVELERFVDATPREVRRALDPVSVVEYEGSFDVFDVEEVDGGTLVTAGGSGLRLTLRFEELDDGIRYEQVDSEGPLETMETTITCAPKDQGSTVRAASTVSLGLPPAAVTDRVAAWKRRGELARGLEALADAVE